MDFTINRDIEVSFEELYNSLSYEEMEEWLDDLLSKLSMCYDYNAAEVVLPHLDNNDIIKHLEDQGYLVIKNE